MLCYVMLCNVTQCIVVYCIVCMYVCLHVCMYACFFCLRAMMINYDKSLVSGWCLIFSPTHVTHDLKYFVLPPCLK